MKKAVISTGSKQYLVAEGDKIETELVKVDGKTTQFDAMLVLDDNKVEVGTPTLAKVKVTAEILEADSQSDKVTSIRYKAKKRVKTVRGHRQHVSLLKITKIA
ncbi:MAG TPA: 50S ribosomal protein L21 [Candidatus Saccharimonadales bacterium]|nr:50S ribosomal protein L21 [Candidatus Saccharimonadales bacterium]